MIIVKKCLRRYFVNFKYMDPGLLTWIVFREVAVWASDDNVLALPRELLYVGAIVGQGHRPPVQTQLALADVRDSLEVL